MACDFFEGGNHTTGDEFLHSFSEQTSLKIEQVKIGMLRPGTLGFFGLFVRVVWFSIGCCESLRKTCVNIFQ